MNTVKIVDLTDKLPRHKDRKWSKRSLSKIDKIIIHQELGEGTIENVNKYHISPNHVSSKGCPRFCYHYGIRKNGEIVQANKMTDVTWHTKGQNTHGIGIMLVGNFAGPGHQIGTTEPTDRQIKSLEKLVPFLIQKFNLSFQELYGHYHFGKPACPGTIIQNWIETKREDISNAGDAVVKAIKNIKEIQRRLNKLGYKAGPEDGIKGVKTLKAVRNFQADNGLMIDGIVGPNTWKNLVLLSL